MEYFTGKTAIVTGASSGIGKATAKAFLKSGANVVAFARNSQHLESLKKECHLEIPGLNKDKGETAKGAMIALSGDVTKDADRQKLLDTALTNFGGIDILVNAAGIIANGTIENTTEAQWDEMFDINLKSVFRMMQLAMPHLIKSRGNIVNVSSVTGVRAFPNVLAYCASKAGVDQLTHCAALEVASKGVRVNAINPGVVVTNLHKASGMNDAQYESFLEHSKSTHPLGRAGSPEEVAELVLFLASENAGWITGVSYSVDGGRAQTCLR
jgi:NAD(P)-dependent dehydrogenase (short-subunit alcohol dehydrogenase family)